MFHKKTRSILVLVAAFLTTSCDDTIIQAFEGSCSDCGSRYCCNGQCTDILSDVNACGSCEIVCKEGQLCQNGRCKTPAGSACDKGCGDNACCGDTCVDLWNDSAHCGSCDEACVTGQICQNGHCTTKCLCGEGEVCDANGACVPSCGGEACAKDALCCNESCVSRNAKDHCGTCENACSGETPVCFDGTCVAQCNDTPTMMACQGECVDTASDDHNCGECGHVCEPGTTCQQSECVCRPRTCNDLMYNCGTTDDGCGNTLDCGTCSTGETCNAHQCGCVPQTCASLGKNCGTIDDGCGKTLNCGSCAADQVCTNNTCGCQPHTCASLGYNCGTLDDGCGKTLNCGSCSGDQTCTANVCRTSCTPTTCAAQGNNCGTISDGCGGSLNCGTCASPQTCQANLCQCTPTTCAVQGKNCGTISDGCGGSLNCGSCSSGQTCTAGKCITTALAYPKRKSIKGIQPDFQDPNQIIGNEGAGVAVNFVWEFWQPSQSGTCAAGQVLYDGYCFTVNSGQTASVTQAVKTYSDAGLVVTAVVYGPPAWARVSCDTSLVAAPYFCAPTEEGARHYGRFAGFIAHYFNGLNGHGRVADFVIHNEVNASEWFNYGCKKGTCNVSTWANVYAQSYNAAYDAIIKEQPNAKVLISFEHHFGKTYDSMLSNARPVVSAETFLSYLIPKVGSRDWRIAWHAYPPDLLKPAFGANDYPRITFGNIGVLAGWLRQNYPSDPHAWEIQLTENGINGTASLRTTQATQLCQAFRNVNGTPGVESFIYHRLMDHSVETASGLALGLWGEKGAEDMKPAWSVWALANRNVGGGYPSCGFEYLPYITLTSGYNSTTKMHYLTTRQLPPGFTAQKQWKILREEQSKTKLYFECRVGGSSGNHAMPSAASNCEGQFNMGPLGYFHMEQISGSVPLYRCYNPTTGDHFVAQTSACDGQKMESLIGYVMPL